MVKRPTKHADENGNMLKPYRPLHEIVELLSEVVTINADTKREEKAADIRNRALRINPEEEWYDNEAESLSIILAGPHEGNRILLPCKLVRVVPQAEWSRLEALAISGGVQNFLGYRQRLHQLLLGQGIRGRWPPTLRTFPSHTELHAPHYAPQK